MEQMTILRKKQNYETWMSKMKKRKKGKQQWWWFSIQPLIDDEEVDCTFLTSQVSHEQKALAVCNAAKDFKNN